jgi:histidine triad (HIT) family protein
MPSPPENCLFCDIVRQGTYIAKTKGFVAINDIKPQAQTHILVIPERHLDTFRDVAELNGGEARRMLEFIAEVARDAGLTDYQVLANVGRSAGQTVFHLHWHVIGDTKSHLDAAYSLTTAVTEL